MESTEKTFLYSWRSVNFGLTLEHQKNSLKYWENGVVFRANLRQPLDLNNLCLGWLYFEILYVIDIYLGLINSVPNKISAVNFENFFEIYRTFLI